MMGKNENRAHRWRKKSKRGVSPIIATILLVAITVVLAAVLYILISGLTKGPGNTPLGTALTLSKPAENVAGANHYYNLTVQAAGGGLIMNNLNFQVQGTGGNVVPPLGSWTLTVVGNLGTTVATYTMNAGTWATGSTVSVASPQVISLNTPSSLSGDTFVVSGASGFQGTVSQTIP